MKWFLGLLGSFFGLVIVALLVGPAWLSTSIVYDYDDQVQIAEFVHSDRREKLTRLPFGIWIGTTHSDGNLTITCKNGKSDATYVSDMWGASTSVGDECVVDFGF